MSRTRYAELADQAEGYLRESCVLRVRFQDVDSMRVVWHGHYLSYFEEGRNALGRRYGISYQHVMDAGLMVPLVHLECEYLQAARFDQELCVDTRLWIVPGARLHFSYEIRDAAGEERLCTGHSTQVFTDAEGEMLLSRPPMYRDFLAANAARISPR